MNEQHSKLMEEPIIQPIYDIHHVHQTPTPPHTHTNHRTIRHTSLELVFLQQSGEVHQNTLLSATGSSAQYFNYRIISVSATACHWCLPSVPLRLIQGKNPGHSWPLIATRLQG